MNKTQQEGVSGFMDSRSLFKPMPHRQDAKTTQLHNQSLHSPRYRTDRGQDLVAVCTQEEVYRKLAEKQRKIEKLRIDLSSGNIKNAQNNDKIIPDARTERKSITGKQTSKAKANLEEESNQKMNIEEGSSGQYRNNQTRNFIKELDSQSRSPINRLTANVGCGWMGKSKFGRSDARQPFLMFSRTRDQLFGYANMMYKQLHISKRTLQQILQETDNALQQNLEREGDKIRKLLYRVVDKQVTEFMKAQRQEQEKDRLVYFSEVFELKDMIEQRIAETETYRDQLANDKDWRYVAQEIIFPELTTAIQILITKAEEIEETIEEQINSYLTQFNQKVLRRIIQPFRRKGCELIQLTLSSLPQNIDFGEDKPSSMKHFPLGHVLEPMASQKSKSKRQSVALEVQPAEQGVKL